jgi:hypothetical protein
MLVFLVTRIGDIGGTGLDIQWLRRFRIKKAYLMPDLRLGGNEVAYCCSIIAGCKPFSWPF